MEWGQMRSNQAFGWTALLGTAPAVFQRGNNRVSQKGNSCCCCEGGWPEGLSPGPLLRSLGARTRGGLGTGLRGTETGLVTPQLSVG